MGPPAPEPGLFCIRWRNKMSYINEALKKAQRDKDAGQSGYIHSIGKSGSTERPFDKRYIYLIFIIILLIASLIYLRIGRQPGQTTVISGKITKAMPVSEDNRNNKTLPAIDKKNGSAEAIPKEDNRKKEIVSNVEALYRQAVSFFKDGNLQKAKDIYKEILEQDPGHIESLNDMGVMALHDGRYEDAVNFFKKAVRLKPNFVNPYYNLACAYSLQNEGKKGMNYLLKALEVDKRVKDWAKEDSDLQNLRKFAEFTLITN